MRNGKAMAREGGLRRVSLPWRRKVRLIGGLRWRLAIRALVRRPRRHVSTPASESRGSCGDGGAEGLRRGGERDKRVAEPGERACPSEAAERAVVLRSPEAQLEAAKGDRQGEAIPAKFWSRRFELFSRFHEGVRLDAESWYSVTPEPIARRVAERMSAGLGAPTGWLWLDAFCGAGGNAIQLAANDPHGVVVGVDIDPHKVELARHNARLYGVEGRIQFVVGDFTALAPRLRAHAVHLSPPWGGCHHRRVKEFDLTQMRVLGSQCDGISLFDLALAISPSIAYYLPAHTWRAQLETLTWKHPSQRSELQEFMRRDGRRDRVHVIAAFFDAKPSSWLLAHSLGMSNRKVRMPRVPNCPAVT